MEKGSYLTTFCFFCFSFIFCFILCAADPPVVEIPLKDSKVHIRGINAADGKSVQYLGLRYAKANRFMHSTSFLSFVDTPIKSSEEKFLHINAMEKAAACSQVCPKENLDCIGSEIQHENCLTLDISVPNTFVSFFEKNNDKKNKKYPVIVFFHGGAMRFGNINAVYTGDIWASKSEVIVVTVSYRLGMLGWIKYGDAFPGNQGFTDQINALIWVKNYIQYFGGDNNNVGISGHSAGAICVSCHLVSPFSKGLFQKAIIMSGSLGDPRKTIEQSESIARNALNNALLVSICGPPPEPSYMNLDYVNCLNKKVSTENILLASEHGSKMAVEIDIFYALHNWEVTVDKIIIPSDCTAALLQGKSDKNVKVIIGTVNDEGALIQSLNLANLLSNPIIYTSAMLYFFSYDSPNLFKFYPPAIMDVSLNKILDIPTYSNLLKNLGLQTVSASKSLQNSFGHYVYNCAARRVARAMRKFNKDVYLYTENRGYEWTKYVQKYTPCNEKDLMCKVYSNCSPDKIVCHAEDMPLLFQRTPLQKRFKFSEDEIKSAQIIYDYFASFMQDGNPVSSNPKASDWPLYDECLDNYQLLGNSYSTPLFNVNKDECDFWDSIIPDYNLTWQQHRNTRLPPLEAFF